MAEYSETFKRKMVQRMSGPRRVTATALAEEVGIPQPTLSRWLRDAGTIRGMTKKDTTSSEPPPRRPEDRTPEEKLRVVNEASRLSESELGAFLRREGLHQADLDAWRDTILGALRPALGKFARSVEVRRVRELEKELRRKDKALAEAAALLVLQKKVRALWGDEDDDTKKEIDE